VAAALAGDEFDEKTPVGQIGRGGAGPRSGTRSQISPPSRRPWFIGAAALAVTAIGGFFWSRSAGGSVNDKSWLVAPFEVQGSDRSLDWLREGSLNMLTLSLAQWTTAGLGTNALDLLLTPASTTNRAWGSKPARDIARKAGARHGRARSSLGDSMIVTANLYDVGTGRSTDRARIAAIRTADPRPLFEAVASELLDLVGAPRISIELAKQTTTSVEAYRHYLEGLRHLNRWRLREADSAFALALKADSTFALAYYKKSLGIGWIAPGLMEQGPLLDNAIKYVDRLPPRQQELVRGHVELSRGFEGCTSSATPSWHRNAFSGPAIDWRDWSPVIRPMRKPGMRWRCRFPSRVQHRDGRVGRQSGQVPHVVTARLQPHHRARFVVSPRVPASHRSVPARRHAAHADRAVG
jgi:hypothetical protein